MLPTSQTHPWEGGSRGYREWQKKALLPKLLCTLSSGCRFTINDHFPPVTKSCFIEEFLPVSAAEPSGSLPGPVPSLQYTKAPFVAARCEGFSWKPEKSEFVGGMRKKLKHQRNPSICRKRVGWINSPLAGEGDQLQIPTIPN